MFAGPNGSGKSTLIDEIRKNYDIGYYINADIIESDLNDKGYLVCSHFSSAILTQQMWEEFKSLYKEDTRFDPSVFDTIKITDNILTVENKLNSYTAALIAEFFRISLIDSSSSFSFETVMSHPSKIEFLQKAKENGFKTYLYFIATQDPDININRVKIRVKKGGHDVSHTKITERYYRSLDLLKDAFMLADRAFILDSSNQSRDVILEKNEKDLILHNKTVPEWIVKCLLDKLKFT